MSLNESLRRAKLGRARTLLPLAALEAPTPYQLLPFNRLQDLGAERHARLALLGSN